LGPSWPLYIGHGLFIGLIGSAASTRLSNVYVSRWFDRRRGSALALISSGAYLAGTVWPPVFARAIAYAGWRDTMLLRGVRTRSHRTTAAIVFRPPPDMPHHATLKSQPVRTTCPPCGACRGSAWTTAAGRLWIHFAIVTFAGLNQHGLGVSSFAHPVKLYRAAQVQLARSGS